MRKEGTNMPNKSSSVIVRIEPDIKTKAEAIMSSLGLPVSVVINALYHQIIYSKGIPFPMSLPKNLPIEEAMSKEEYEEMFQISLSQVKNGEVEPAIEAINSLRPKNK